MTDWDTTYLNKGMPKPTDLRDLMPDPYGHFDRLADERIDRIVAWVVRGITVLVAIGIALAAWTVYERLLP